VVTREVPSCPEIVRGSVNELLPEHACEIRGFHVVIFVMRFYFKNSSTVKVVGEFETIFIFYIYLTNRFTEDDQ
jgi:hypothetical protein